MPAARRHQGEQVTILVNKPIGYVSGQAEDGYQPASVLIRPENRWAEDRAPSRSSPATCAASAPAGRLDIDSTGLIVFTQDGRVARRLIGRDSEVEKEYLVRVEGTLSPRRHAIARSTVSSSTASTRSRIPGRGHARRRGAPIPSATRPSSSRAFIRSEIDLWGIVIRATGAKVE